MNSLLGKLLILACCAIILLSCFDEVDLHSKIYNLNKTEFLEAYSKIEAPLEKVNIIHISDVHIWDGDSELNLSQAINLIAEDSIEINAVVCTGDLTIGFDSYTKKSDVIKQLDINKQLALKSNVPFLSQLGNHDSNDDDGIVSSSITKREQWETYFEALSLKWAQIKWGDKTNFRHYHYYDINHPTGNIRVIVLDQLDHDCQVDSNNLLIYRSSVDAVYSQKQIDWLCNVALDTPPNTGIIICNHFPFMHRGNKKTSLLINGQFIQSWKMIPDIIDAWKNRSQIRKTYKDSKNLQNISVNADFSKQNSNNEFITYLVGHVHHKTHGLIEGYNQIYLMENTLGQGKGLFSPVDRERNTISSSAFSMLSIDRSKKVIYRTSYGAYDMSLGSRIEEIKYSK